MVYPYLALLPGGLGRIDLGRPIGCVFFLVRGLHALHKEKTLFCHQHHQHHHKLLFNIFYDYFP